MESHHVFFRGSFRALLREVEVAVLNDDGDFCCDISCVIVDAKEIFWIIGAVEKVVHLEGFNEDWINSIYSGDDPRTFTSSGSKSWKKPDFGDIWTCPTLSTNHVVGAQWIHEHNRTHDALNIVALTNHPGVPILLVSNSHPMSFQMFGPNGMQYYQKDPKSAVFLDSKQIFGSVMWIF